MLPGPTGGLGAGVDVEFGVDVGEVKFDGALLDAQHVANLLVCPAACEQG